MAIHECKNLNLCECGYIEDEEFAENWEETINAKLRQSAHVIAVGNG